MLRVANLPFVGSDVLSPQPAWIKTSPKRLLRDAGLNIAPFITLTRTNRHAFSLPRLNPVWDCRCSLSLPIRLFGRREVANEAQYRGRRSRWLNLIIAVVEYVDQLARDRVSRIR